MRKILFLISDKEKILYENGNIKKVKKMDDLFVDMEVRFVRKMIRICPCLPPHIFVARYRDEKLNDKYTVLTLRDRLYMHNFIVFFDHENKRAELFIDDNEVDRLDYEKKEFLRKYFYVVRGGIYLESVSSEEIEMINEYESINRFWRKIFRI